MTAGQNRRIILWGYGIMGITVSDFGSCAKGVTKLYTLKAGRYSVSVSDFGATLVSFTISDDKGKTTDVVLGHDNAAEYEAGGGHLGAVVGRHANRIGGSSFVLNGQKVTLTPNENGHNNLHSGPDFYGKRIFAVEPVDEKGNAVTFVMDSPDGDQGFPGHLTLKVTYSLTEDGSLTLHYEAVSDADTICNPTNHVYFNLDGEGSGSILDHVMKICADRIVCIDHESIPTGDLREVADSPFDFREPKKVGRDIGAADEQLKNGTGYDHCFCLSEDKTQLRKVVEVYSEKTGIALDVSTDLPGIQFYSGNYLQDMTGKQGKIYHDRDGFALETEYYPDSVNKPAFAQPVLKAGETFSSDTVYRLSYRK